MLRASLKLLRSAMAYELIRSRQKSFSGTPRKPAQEEILGNYLLERNLCSPQEIERAAIAARREKIRLDEALLRLGLLSDTDRAEFFSHVTGSPIAQRSMFPQKPVLETVLRRPFLLASRVIPLSADEVSLTLAMENPADQSAVHMVAFAARKAVNCLTAKASDLDDAFRRLYPTPLEKSAPTSPPDRQTLADDEDRLEDMASEAPVIRFVNELLSKAVEEDASDIHLQQDASGLSVRMRRDGLLRPSATENHNARAVVARLKVMASLDIAESRLPQDGKLTLPVNGVQVEVRISTCPGVHGESVVLRILNKQRGPLPLDATGLEASLLQRWRDILQLPNGLVLVAGPTGCGKTTTIAASLTEISQSSRSVVSIEDPVEYEVPGVRQIQIRPQIELNFANVLRSVLRQDPDIIVVGEIRDLETARLALRAATTGHLVISTIHTNSACGAITRLLDLGIAPYLLKANLRAVVSQRLLRLRCGACSGAPQGLPGYLVQCAKCGGTTYSGRAAIGELLEVGPALWSAVGLDLSENAIERAALSLGFRTLSERGNELVRLGRTTEAELKRCGVVPAAREAASSTVGYHPIAARPPELAIVTMAGLAD